MVRHGRLSQGCQTCRKRKIKCDKALPACSQCLKAGWNCPKYGDVLERMFQHKNRRDFVPSVDPKAPSPDVRIMNCASKPLSPTYQAFILAKATSSPNRYQSTSITLSPEITPSISSRAIEFFLSTHVFRECGIPRGYYEYLTTFINGIGSSAVLVSSLTAVSLAVYAFTFSHRPLLQYSRHHYGHALRLLNTALSSPLEIVRSSTLSSVLLLSTFDTIVGQSKETMVPCMAHMMAAMSLLCLNGHGLVKSNTCTQLMLHVSWVLFQTLITTSKRVPEDVISIRRISIPALDINDPSWKLSTIVIQLADFRADVKEGILFCYDEIIQKALEIDSELSNLQENMPPSFHFQSITLKESTPLVFGTTYHIYPDQWIAYIHNNLRTSRLLLHKEILHQLNIKLTLSPLSFSNLDKTTYQTSIKILQQMISQICSTIPQYSGYLHLLTTTNTNLSSPSPLKVSSTTTPSPLSPCTILPPLTLTNGIPTPAGTYLLFWPLLNAGQTTTDPLQKKWLIERSRCIGSITGIQPSFVMADIIEKGEKLWGQT